MNEGGKGVVRAITMFFSAAFLLFGGLFAGNASASILAGSVQSRTGVSQELEVRAAVGARPETGGIWCVQTTVGTVAAPCTNSGLIAFTSIQSAIAAASSGDEIRLSGGT